MSESERLLNIYRKWPEGKLLQEYAKKNEYSTVAIQSMQKVLDELGLLGAIETGELGALLQKEEKEADLAQKAWIEDRPQRAFYENLTADKTGVYLEGILLNKTKHKLGNKGAIKVFKHGDEILMDLIHGSFKELIKPPFHCHFFATKSIERTNFFKTSEWFVLHVLIKTATGELIRLEEKQKNFKKLPDHFELINYNDSRLDTQFAFQYFNTEVQLTDLVKLLVQFKA